MDDSSSEEENLAIAHDESPSENEQLSENDVSRYPDSSPSRKLLWTYAFFEWLIRVGIFFNGKTATTEKNLFLYFLLAACIKLFWFRANSTRIRIRTMRKMRLLVQPWRNWIWKMPKLKFLVICNFFKHFENSFFSNSRSSLHPWDGKGCRTTKRRCSGELKYAIYWQTQTEVKEKSTWQIKHQSFQEN